jgi:hypothetical protein
MFRSRNEWFAHELQCHRREWVCQFCQHDAFPTAEMFSNHINSTHSAALAHSKIEAMILQSEEPVTRIPPDACPLCNEWETGIRDSTQGSKMLRLNESKIVKRFGTPKQFRRHLGRHMEQLALFALPVQESDELEEEIQDEQQDDYTDSGDEKLPELEPEDVNIVETLSVNNQYSPLPLSYKISQWNLDVVLLWLAENGFSNDWQETFKTLNIHGSTFFELGTTHPSGSFALMHQQVFPCLARQTGGSGTGWDQTRERLEGRRLRRLVRSILKELSSDAPKPRTDNE